MDPDQPTSEEAPLFTMQLNVMLHGLIGNITGPQCLDCVTKNPIIIIFLISYEVSWQTVWVQISQLLRKLADLDPTVYHAAYVMMHDLVDIMTVSCFHMLKIASDGNFFLLLEKTTSI